MFGLRKANGSSKCDFFQGCLPFLQHLATLVEDEYIITVEIAEFALQPQIFPIRGESYASRNRFGPKLLPWQTPRIFKLFFP